MSTVSLYQQEFYLCMKVASGKGGQALILRLAMRPPALEKGEIMMKMNLEVPKFLFEKPSISATISIPPDRAAHQQISADIGQQIADIVKRDLGVDVKLKLVEP